MTDINYKELLFKVLDTIEGEYIRPIHCDPENGPSEDDVIFAPVVEGMILRKFDGTYYRYSRFQNHKDILQDLITLEEFSVDSHELLMAEYFIVSDPRFWSNKLPVGGSPQKILHDNPWLVGATFRVLDIPELCEDVAYEITRDGKSLTYTTGPDEEVYIHFPDGTGGNLREKNIRKRFKHYFNKEDSNE